MKPLISYNAVKKCRSLFGFLKKEEPSVESETKESECKEEKEEPKK